MVPTARFPAPSRHFHLAGLDKGLPKRTCSDESAILASVSRKGSIYTDKEEFNKGGSAYNPIPAVGAEESAANDVETAR